MSNRGSRVTSPSKNPINTYQHSYVSIDPTFSNINGPTQQYSSYSLPNKYAYSGPSVNTYNQSRFTTDQVSQLTGSRIKQGQVVKGQSRIQYVPYEKKIIEYETKTITERVPKTRKVVDYEERKVIQTVPRQVIKQDFYAVQKITQYYKQIIPQKKVQIVPIEKKVKRIQYVPVQKQIVHYPQNEDWRSVKGQSRVVLESQGVAIKPDAEFRPIQSDLLYKYVASQANSTNLPVGYVDLGSRRYLSTAPTFVGNNNLGVSNVQLISGNNSSYIAGNSFREPLNFQQSQVFYNPEPPTFINRVNQDNFSNVISGSKYQYRYGNVNDYQPTNYKQKF